MDMSIADPVRDELLKTNPMFRELVHQHEDYERRLSELAHLTFPSDEEQLEEVTLKKKKLAIKDEIYEMMHAHTTGH
ncbi:MAG: YdcH family protein [Pyrinomonadaceae bacterium]|nr:YdcH family protein [Pyrinomonadaceae bacterium]